MLYRRHGCREPFLLSDSLNMTGNMVSFQISCRLVELVKRRGRAENLFVGEMAIM